MRKKYISLIYKKLDGTISEKESSRLDKYLSQDTKYLEEYNLISNLFEELKNTPQKELPENFSKNLKARLIDYNISKKEKKAYQLPIFQTALALAVVVLIVFTASNYFPAMHNSDNTQEYEAVRNEDITKNINNNENDSQSQENKHPPELLTRSVLKSTSPRNASIRNSDSAVEATSLDNSINLPIINCAPGVFELLNEKPLNAQLTFPINRYKELKETIKDYIISIENEDNIEAESFIINEVK